MKISVEPTYSYTLRKPTDKIYNDIQPKRCIHPLIPDCNPHNIPKPIAIRQKKDQTFQSKHLHESIIWSKNAYKIFLDPKNTYAAIISVLSF